MFGDPKIVFQQEPNGAWLFNYQELATERRAQVTVIVTCAGGVEVSYLPDSRIP
jgi:hypothetical protein